MSCDSKVLLHVTQGSFLIELLVIIYVISECNFLLAENLVPYTVLVSSKLPMGGQMCVLYV